jgi:hypothetical protein
LVTAVSLEDICESTTDLIARVNAVLKREDDDSSFALSDIAQSMLDIDELIVFGGKHEHDDVLGTTGGRLMPPSK